MVSSEFGAPSSFLGGFNPADVAAGLYGSSLHVWSWPDRKLLHSIDLGPEGLLPLEVRFAHRPDAPYGFVDAALSGNVHLFRWDAAARKMSTKARSIRACALGRRRRLLCASLLARQQRRHVRPAPRPLLLLTPFLPCRLPSAAPQNPRP